MILTLTPNPSIDVHLHVEGRLESHGELNRASRVEKRFAGKGVQVSRALARDGVPSTAMAWCGEESLATLLRMLREEAYFHHLVPVPGEIRRNVHLHAPHPDAPWKVNEAGPVLGPADVEECIAVYTEVITNRPSLIALCGTLPPGVEPAVMGRLVSLARQHGIPLAVDSSGAALAAAAAALPALLKVNHHEAAELLGVKRLTDGDLPDAAQQLHRRGIRQVVITNGPRPGVAVDGDGTRWLVHPAVFKPVTTVGAGDNFLAGLLSGAVKGMDFPGQLQHAVYTSAAHCLAGAAVPEFPKPERL